MANGPPIVCTSCPFASGASYAGTGTYMRAALHVKGSIDRSSNPETCKTISAKGWEDKGNDAQVGRATGPRLSCAS